MSKFATTAVIDEPTQAVDIATRLYAAGGFTIAGTVAADRIACWDGATWSNLGIGPTIGGIYTSLGQLRLAKWNDGSGDSLCVGADFTSIAGFPASSLARWNGSAWSALLPFGLPLNGIVGGLTTLPTATS